jgi:hypothetical protein
MRTITLKTPPGELAAVQIEASSDGQEWRVVGAEPVKGANVAAACKLEPTDKLIRCLWVFENSTNGILTTGAFDLTDSGLRRLARGGRGK